MELHGVGCWCTDCTGGEAEIVRDFANADVGGVADVDVALLIEPYSHAVAAVGPDDGHGMGVALDQQGNLYISDSTNIRIRKVSNNLRFAASAVGTPAAHTVQLHFIPSDAPSTIALSSPDFTLSTGACTTSSDTTQDCIYTAT